MPTEETRRQVPLLDPNDGASLAAATVDEILGSAEEWARYGVLQRATALLRVILQREPENGVALAALARSTAREGVDEADALYTRADSADGLGPADYKDWFGRLFDAQRPRQAADVARRVRQRFQDDPAVRSWVAVALAACGDMTPSDLLSELREGFVPDCESTLEFLTHLQDRLGVDEVWVQEHEIVSKVLNLLSASGDYRVLMGVASIFLRLDDLNRASSYLDRALAKIDTASLRDNQMEAAKIHASELLTYIAASWEHDDEVLELLDSVRAISDASKVVRVSALYGTGRLDEALRLADEVIGSVRSAIESGAGDRSLLRNALLNRASVFYDCGRFEECWEDIRAGIKLEDSANLNPSIHSMMVELRCRVDPRFAEQANHEFVELLRREPPIRRGERELVQLSQATTLAYLAEHDRGSVTRATLVAREAMAQRDRVHETVVSKSRTAYLALLAGDEEVACSLLHEIAQDNAASWRIQALQAIAELRARRPRIALEISNRLVQHRPHDLDVRCTLIQAALLSGETALGIKEAEALVRFAPNHVHAQLLLAECHRRDAQQVTSADQPEDYQRLIHAVRHYATAFRLHDGLLAFMAAEETTNGVGSQLLSTDSVVHAARQGARAAARAIHIMERCGLPIDQGMLREGHSMAERLGAYEPDEAHRLHLLLDAPKDHGKWIDRWRQWRWWILGLALLGLTQAPTVGHRQYGEQQIALAILALLAFSWPYMSGFTLLGVQVQRSAPPKATDNEILRNPVTGSLIPLALPPPTTPPSALQSNVSDQASAAPPSGGPAGAHAGAGRQSTESGAGSSQDARAGEVLVDR